MKSAALAGCSRFGSSDCDENGPCIKAKRQEGRISTSLIMVTLTVESDARGAGR